MSEEKKEGRIFTAGEISRIHKERRMELWEVVESFKKNPLFQRRVASKKE